MSERFQKDVNFLNGIDYTELKKFGRFSTLTLKTNEVASNDTVEFPADSGEAIVSSVDILPEGEVKPKTARVLALTLNISSGSTDSSVSMFQSSGFEEINRVASVTALSQGGTPSTFNLGGGLGNPFTNKQGENEVYFKIEENSGNPSTYEIELNWANIPR
ncbi:MAG: hypothetical protein J07AB43_01550 [Candidatus Nanosalina sp. J07AB43]|jgi:hypothetical protein|nr:MAG: hypothetical protein J07AB43_01550 [Candidatus Nanosalina sp. J07AB43]